MPSIRDFSGGVVNQELLGKDGGAGIMIDANNVLSSWNGELRKRTGSRIIAQLEKKSRIIPYRLPNNDDALLLFTDGNVKGYEITDAGLSPLYTQKGASEIDFPLNGWSSNSRLGWTVGTNIPGEYFYNAFNPGQQFESIESFFWVKDTSADKYFSFFNETPFVLENLSIGFGAIFTDYGYFSGATILYSDDGNIWTPVKTQENISFYASGHNRTATVSVISSLTTSAHKYWRVFFTNRFGTDNFYVAFDNVSCSGASSNVPVDFATHFSEKDLDKISFAQSGDRMFFACNNKQPMYLDDANDVPFGDFIPDNNVWAVNGKPSCVSVFQNRLAFSGFESFKGRAVLSEFGNFENFTVKTSDVKSTDPISADSVELRSKITNLWAGNNALYALSSDGVSMIDAQGGIIATNQISFKLRNREPADGMTPTTKDDIMIYLGNDRRKIFITDYDFIVQRFKAKDLSIGYNGFLTSRIVALHYASRRCSLIYGYKDDGNMLALLFDVDLQKNALFPCNISGDIKDMQVFKSGDKFRVLMVAQIEDRWYLIEKNEQPEYSVMDFMTKNEKIAYTESLMRNGLYLDYMTRRYYNSPVSTITDLPYGVGTKVAVFADGVYVGEKECIAGAIVLDSPAKDFVLGYNYDAYAVLKLATPYTSKKYPKEVATYLINTGYLEIGNSFDNLQPILNNMKDKLDLFDKPMLLNGEYTKTMDKLDNSPYIILRSNEPMPFMITGIDFKVDYSNYQGGI